MRRSTTAALAVATLLTLGATKAGASPADEGNCISTRDNGRAAGARVSSFAGPGFGQFVADAIGGGALGATASDPECRRQ